MPKANKPSSYNCAAPVPGPCVSRTCFVQGGPCLSGQNGCFGPVPATPAIGVHYRGAPTGKRGAGEKSWCPVRGGRRPSHAADAGMGLRGGAVCHIRAISAAPNSVAGASFTIHHSSFCLLLAARARAGSRARVNSARKAWKPAEDNGCFLPSPSCCPLDPCFLTPQVSAFLPPLPDSSFSEFQLSAFSLGVGVQLD
jgi:hypothetical protein